MICDFLGNCWYQVLGRVVEGSTLGRGAVEEKLKPKGIAGLLVLGWVDYWGLVT